jgi:FixJ family two-component response regulator
VLQVEDGPYPVLVVDHDAQVAQTLGARLSGYNCITHCSCSYNEAISFLDARNDILVVLADVEMPGASGLSIANYMSKIRNETTLSNLIVMIGGACDQVSTDVLRAKVFDFTRKPIRIADLAARVQSAAIDALRRRQRAADTQRLREQLSVMPVERARLEASLERLVDANHAIAANGHPASTSFTVPAVELQRVLVPGVVPDADHIQPEQAFRYAAVVASAADHLDDKTLLEFVLRAHPGSSDSC